MRAPGPEGWAVVTPEAFQLVFAFAFELSRRSPGLAALAATDRWDGRSCAKLYRDGRVLWKAGADPDEELPYLFPPSEAEAYAEVGRALVLPAPAAAALAGWGRRVAAGETPDLDALVAAFGLPEAPGRFRDLRAAAGEGGREPLLFVHRTSPLVRNA